jgi:hypothetical protein
VGINNFLISDGYSAFASDCLETGAVLRRDNRLYPRRYRDTWFPFKIATPFNRSLTGIPNGNSISVP